MRITDIKPMLKELLKNLRAVNRLVKCGMVDQYNTEFKYKDDDIWFYDNCGDPDCYEFEVQMPHCEEITMISYSLGGEINIHFKNREEMVCQVQLWLTAEGFFQSTTLYDFGDTDLQYWKDCVALLPKIIKENK